MKVTPLALALLLSETQTVSQLFSLGPHSLRTQLSDFILHGVQTKVLGIEDSFSFFALLSLAFQRLFQQSLGLDWS